MLYWQTGTLNLYDHGHGALEQADKLAADGGWWILSMAGLIAVLLFFGAMGKSAQFPLHVWLPDAMEGPTPVSALIHAATMVAAGVFMVGRMFPLFTAGAVEGGSTPALDFVMWIGCFTAVFSATIAVGQFDIKRVLAYSTCSQLGYMVMALGAGGLVAGQFHLLTHAFFKALLFLGSGSRDHRHASRTGHAEDGRAAQVHADHVRVLHGRHAGAGRCAAVCGVLLEG